MGFGRYVEVGRMDDLARLDSPVHRLDARTKVLTTVAFIVAVMSFPRYEVSALMPFFLFPLVLMNIAGIPSGLILRKLMLAAPFALVVGVFNPLLERQIVMTAGVFDISGGWLSFASIILRFILTVSAALVLVACTGIHRLGAGLIRLGMPRVFAVQIQLLHRYLFVMTDDAVRMVRAFEMRSVGPSTPRFGVYASMTGHLLLRSLERAQGIYEAMVSRGYDGTVRVMSPTAIRFADVLFFAGWLIFFIAARTWNLSLLLGGLITGL
ncbi:MAG: cobalt ECF transporter T component CbiQ [bacterium]